MPQTVCPRCDGNHTHKGGIANGKPRWYCRTCTRYFSESTRGPNDHPLKDLVIASYARNGSSFRGIARMLGISHVTAYKWVRAAAEALPEPAVAPPAEIVIVDEMHHFIKKKLKRSGSGVLSTE